jgi:hypothetical protein
MAYEVEIEEVEYLRHGATPYIARMFKPRGAGSFPAVIDGHGGAWQGGDRFTNDPINEAVAKGGVVVAALDFRNPPVATYPQGSIQDINYGVRWLKANAARFGSRPEMVGAMGTSSGGHLVVLSAIRPDDPRYSAVPLPGGERFDARVPYVVALWPVICPASRYRGRKGQPPDPGGVIGNEHRYWITEAAMEEGSPNFIVMRQESIAKPNILYLQNPIDTQHPRANLESFVRGYRELGGNVDLQWFTGEKYDAVRTDPTSQSARDAVAKIHAFIHKEANAAAGAAAK